MMAADTPIEVLLRELAAPAQRAIASQGISTLEQLAACSPQQMMAWHGIGQTALTVILRVLSEHGFEIDEEV
jgi:hypothetical protein